MQDLLHQWLEHQTAPVAVTNRDGRLAGTSAAFESLLAAQQVSRKPPADNMLTMLQMLCEQPSDQQTLVRIRKVLQADSPPAVQSFVLAQGAGRFCRITLLPQQQADNRWIWLFEDASQSLRLEQHQTHSEKMHAISRLAGGIAHELNNMLTAVLGHLELMKLKAEQHPQFQLHIASAEQAAFRASALIQELRRFAGREQQFQQLQPVLPVLQRVVKRLKEIAPAGINVRIDAENESQLQCRCNAIQLEEALLKLGENAIEAVGATTGEVRFQVQLRQQLEHSVLQILVQDSGTGLSELSRKHVFEPFFTTKDPARSAGLGMAVACELIQEMGGTIEIAESSPTGTKLVLSFPIAGDLSGHAAADL